MLRYLGTDRVAKFMNPVFIETGTYMGDGISFALEVGFQKIISIELLDCYFGHAQRMFAGNGAVTLVQGNSGDCLWNTIKDINEKITFWLDGHSFPENCPIMAELEQIRKHPIRDHDILIDDIASITTLPGLSRHELEMMILTINSNYRVTYFDRGGTDVLIASMRQ